MTQIQREKQLIILVAFYGPGILQPATIGLQHAEPRSCPKLMDIYVL